ncbi:MAG: anhydro-N-acetylmuramic acid kinase, partial [Turicibacter sp.]|nr:anhydro-N-acetylmuramic acid kinase [Turicibacter sp.]
GEPAVIAYETKIPVVSNFRTMDMAAGGQGAPLVPYTEWLLYGDAEKSRLLQNIGGIGNVTLIPKNCGLDEVIAFDTGPGNMVMDEICKLLFNQNYDKDGLLAAKGTLNQGMLSDLLSMPYILEAPPKSTGRELFGKEFVLRLIEKYAHVAPYDLLATATYFTAKSIALNYEAFIFPDYPIDEVIVGGGGSYNKQLMAMLSELLEGKCRVMAQEDCGYSSEAKEAIAFALLANETMNHIPSNVPSATGAKEAVVLGNITII